MKRENHTCMSFEYDDMKISGLHCFNLRDGIRPRGGGRWEICHSWLKYIRDDCAKNGAVTSGLI